MALELPVVTKDLAIYKLHRVKKEKKHMFVQLSDDFSLFPEGGVITKITIPILAHIHTHKHARIHTLPHT